MDKIRVGVVGSGYVSNYFYLTFHQRYRINKVLTRRAIAECRDYANPEVLTNNPNELLQYSDIILECSGDPVYATEIIAKAFAANLPVITTNTEFHVTCGSYFVDKGLITEALGDQPGALAALHNQAQLMGFKPLAYLNIKGFYNPNPSREDMHYWAKRNGISLASVTSFTDGTKIQFEQALVANGCGATFLKTGMMGLQESDYQKAAIFFGDKAKEIGIPICDYIIFPGAPHGVMVIAEHLPLLQPMLRYVKMGEGPYYILRQDAILIHLDIPKTIEDLLLTKKPILTNSQHPRISVAAVAKRKIKKGEVIQGVGGFDVRGIGVKIREHPQALPIGLIQNARAIHDIEPEQILQQGDIELPDTLAKKAWDYTRTTAVINNS